VWPAAEAWAVPGVCGVALSIGECARARLPVSPEVKRRTARVATCVLAPSVVGCLHGVIVMRVARIVARVVVH
jgi:hypothetical protein